jgi:hypothetical protein
MHIGSRVIIHGIDVRQSSDSQQAACARIASLLTPDGIRRPTYVGAPATM